MKLKLYKRPQKTGWLGWLETDEGNARAFFKLDGTMVRWHKKNSP